MKKRSLVFTLVVVLVLTFSFVALRFTASASATSVGINSNSGAADINGNTTIKVNKNKVAVKIKSTGNGKTTPDDILALRAERDQVRADYIHGKNSGLTEFDETIVDANGNVILDCATPTAFTIPDIPDNKPLLRDSHAVNNGQIKKMLEDVCAQIGIHVKVKSCSDSKIIGKKVEIELLDHNDNFDTINQQIPELQAVVNALNQNDTMITGYTLFVNDKNNNPLVVLSADLLYGDIIWWQTEAMQGDWLGTAPQNP